MKVYEFTLKFSLSSESQNPDAYVEKLGAAGCDDALIGVGQNGRIALSFTRESTSAYEAIVSAVENVKTAIPDAKLVEATPDFVGLSDIADILGFTRQNMRKLMISSGSAFPPPVHEGKPALWHLANILSWMKAHRNYQIDADLLDVARINMQFNLVKELNYIEPAMQKDIRALIA